MIAPIRTGGGVRVKILDAARMGLPVVGTTAAVGSLGGELLGGLGVFDGGDAAFIEQCRKYLLDNAGAAEAGDRLYRLNQRYWTDHRPHRAVAELLGGRSG